jgi:pantothenate kinase-related protein Tda10
MSSFAVLQEVNELLRPYEALNLLMDAWLVLAVPDPAVVRKWRLQAEHHMAQQGRGGLTDEQVSCGYFCF